MFNNLREHKEVRYLFDRYKNSENRITYLEIQNFMIEKQNVKMSSFECAKLINIILIGETAGTPDYNAFLSYPDFTEFLFSPILNAAVSHEHKHKLSDMTQPLVKYLCFSSHNTYLAAH